MGPDGPRPPTETDLYILAYVCGVVLLLVVTAVAVWILRRRAIRLWLPVVAAVTALLAGLALWEEYHVGRAETCYRLMLRLQAGEGWFPIRSRDGLFVQTGSDGSPVSSSGTLPEVEAYLKKKYDHWFSGSILRLRNILLPTRACTLSHANAREG